MNVALHVNRKRSRLTYDSDDEGEQQRDEEAEAGLADLKKTKTQSELDEIGIVAPEEAWAVDMDGILTSPMLPKSGHLRPHNNTSRYVKGSSIIVLCVQGNMHLHYDLLWYVP